MSSVQQGLRGVTFKGMDIVCFHVYGLEDGSHGAQGKSRLREAGGTFREGV